MGAVNDSLLLRAIDGDEDALSQLLVDCDADLRTRLAGQIGRRYRSVLSLDDVLQVTYLEAFLGIHVFEPDGDSAFLHWLVRIAENNIRDGIRELGRKKRPPRRRNLDYRLSDKSYETLLSTLAGTRSSPSRQMARSEVHDRLEEGLSKLPPDYEAVVGQFLESICDMFPNLGRVGQPGNHALTKILEILLGLDAQPVHDSSPGDTRLMKGRGLFWGRPACKLDRLA